MQHFFRFMLSSLLLCVIFLSQAARADAGAAEAAVLLGRVGYGPGPGDVERLRQLGVNAYLEAQLSPEKIPESPALLAALSGLSYTSQSSSDLYRTYVFAEAGASREDKLVIRKQRNAMMDEEKSAKIFRALYSRRQLQEVMTDFWFNHFNVFMGKRDVFVWLPDYENKLRENSLGNFYDLLLSTAQHPAMLRYLDNLQSQAPLQDKKGRAKGLNENYARELMELHTLGVHGGYGQQDVIALAKILTGWTVSYRGVDKGADASFRFDPRMHVTGSKILLGQKVEEAGEQEGIVALHMLAEHPATARHISEKLARYFVADDPPKGLVDDMSAAFMKSHGDIKTVLRAMFSHPAFQDSLRHASLYKTPYQYSMGLLRASGVKVENTRAITGFMAASGMPLYGWRTPDGYDYSQKTWLQPDGLILRIEFANRLAERPQVFSEKNDPLDDSVLRKTLDGLLSENTLVQLSKAAVERRAVLLLASPDLMRR